MISTTDHAPRERPRRAPLAPGLALALTVASGALYGLAFPPRRATLLAWIALAPFLLALREARPRRRLALGVAWSLIAGYCVGTWMPGSVSSYFHQPLAVGVALFLLVAGLMAAPYYAAFALAYPTLARRSGIAQPFLAAAAWSAAELARGRLLNGALTYVGNSPWATFGYAQAGVLPVLQIASVAGVYGVSFLLVAVNAGVAEVAWQLLREGRIDRQGWRGLGAAVGVASAAALGGAVVLGSAGTAPAPVTVAIAQGNLDAALRWGSDGPLRTLEAYGRLTEEAFAHARPDVVFWPETAVTFFLEQDEVYARQLSRIAREHGAEIVLGAPRSIGRDGAGPHTNSVYLVAADGALAARYDKQDLLPFMEYFPLGVAMARRRFGRVREYVPGEAAPLLPTRAGAAGVLVCNEGLLPHLAAQRMAEGAAVLVNPSNDSWVPDAGFAWQQFDIVALRAIEQRTTVLRVSDSGPSGVIDPYGRIVAHSEPQTRAVVIAGIAPAPGRSLYGRVGDLFGGACAIAASAALLRARREGRRPAPNHTTAI